jgi:hypothetical protein
MVINSSDFKKARLFWNILSFSEEPGYECGYSVEN